MTDLGSQISARRRARDRLASLAINAAGSAVIVLIVMILAYLIYLTLPLAQQVKIESVESTQLNADTVIALAGNGELWSLPLQDSAAADRVLVHGRWAAALQGSDLRVFTLETGPSLRRDGELPQASSQQTLALGEFRRESLVLAGDGSEAMLAYWDARGDLQVLWLSRTQAPPSLQVSRWSFVVTEFSGAELLLNPGKKLLLAVRGDRYQRFALNPGAQRASQVGGVLAGLEAGVQVLAWGPDSETLLVVDRENRLHRYDPARADLPRLGAPQLLPFAPRWIESETERRLSYLLGAEGELLLLIPSTGDVLFHAAVPQLSGPGTLGISGDGAFLYRLEATRLTRVVLRNNYPETSLGSLWKRQWFGAYDEPGYIWHPDGGAIGVLSKLSLSPLLYGTFKAALYGMCFAIPLALGAAVYTGYFLPPRLRNRIKPAIEMLEAFPTVVLGFIAGLWLAPLLLNYLVPIMLLPLLLLALPLLLALIHLVLQYVSPRFVRRPPRVALVAVTYLVTIGALVFSGDGLELWLLGSSAEDWLWKSFGVSYEQRNALLVGMAMGIAITPSMFSIIEDSIYAVPRSLSDGSLALGATRWQSLYRVVLPAASPAILSALLIGLARGLGETMIVLLATGNTPLMDPGLFSGMRSLSATLAVELPEAGVESVHFRLLFLAALVLFGLTFVLNTVAEILRQRLRYAYASR